MQQWYLRVLSHHSPTHNLVRTPQIDPPEGRLEEVAINHPRFLLDLFRPNAIVDRCTQPWSCD
jgi:hypothetical protein